MEPDYIGSVTREFHFFTMERNMDDWATNPSMQNFNIE